MRNKKIGIIGLGYVGLPVAIAFSKKYKVIGYDINLNRINSLSNYTDSTNEITDTILKKALSNNLSITNYINDLSTCNVYIITVPTPIDANKNPDLTALISATSSVGDLIVENDIIIYESTVYPGCTEELCVPILEKKSNLTYNKDFFCGYSPERINPGDKKHTIENVIKVVSGSTPQITKVIDKLYSSVITAGTYVTSSIKIAEAAKVIENAQRDINIAFINELAIIFNKIKLDTNEVLDAASSKWNFLNFRPGLVGGHCIGVDPYYLAYKAKNEGYVPEMILAGRKVNDSVGMFVANQVIEEMKNKNLTLEKSRVLILGFAFKENCPDHRNTRVIDIINELVNQKLNYDVYDPVVDKESVYNDYKINMIDNLKDKDYDAIIVAVSHEKFKKINLINLVKSSDSIIYDVKGFLEKKSNIIRL
tara:strand:- start:496 stop:1764 length:1269 start_codon:yes stop_codon:yes gene_type:complete